MLANHVNAQDQKSLTVGVWILLLGGASSSFSNVGGSGRFRGDIPFLPASSCLPFLDSSNALIMYLNAMSTCRFNIELLLTILKVLNRGVCSN